MTSPELQGRHSSDFVAKDEIFNDSRHVLVSHYCTFVCRCGVDSYVIGSDLLQTPGVEPWASMATD